MPNELVGKMQGCVLICGSAPCLIADFHLAKQYRKEAAVMAINDAVSVVRADFLATLHPEDSLKFMRKNLNPSTVIVTGQHYNAEHHVHFWFTDCNSGGTTAGSAIKIAKAMGYSEIILCGCPMRGGDGYFDAPPKPNKFGMSMRFGNAPSTCRVVRTHQEHLAFEAHAADYSMVKSMSGWTAELFGKPEFTEKEAA